MIKVSKKEIIDEKYPTWISKNRGRTTELTKILDTLDIKEGMVTMKNEWGLKTPPSIYVGSAFRETKDRGKKKFYCNLLENKKGWLILRKI